MAQQAKIKSCQLQHRVALNRVLGSGSFGNVYAGCPVEQDPCPFAIKVQFWSSHEDARRQLQNEIAIAELMGNVGLAPRIYEVSVCSPESAQFQTMFYDLPPDLADLRDILMEDLVEGLRAKAQDYSSPPAYIFVGMDNVPGESLASYLHDHTTLPPQLVKQLRKAIDAMHALGVYHGDLSPDNILVQENDQGQPVGVKLTDFTLSRLYPGGVPLAERQQDLVPLEGVLNE